MFYIKKSIFLVFLLSSLFAFSQERHTISGTVYDDSNNETLIGVSIYFPELNSGTTTNQYGFYSITLPEGIHKIQVSYLGYSTIIETIDLQKKEVKDYKLKEESESLDEISLKEM